MRKPLIAAAVLATAMFSTGYIIGQVRGPAASSAASATATATTPQQGWTHPSGPGGGPWGHFGPRADGTVTAINGDTVTVKKDSDAGQTDEYQKVTTIKLTGSTVYGGFRDSGSTATKSAIKVGSYIIAEGTLSSDGATLTASHVSVMPSGAGSWGNGSGAPAFAPPSGGFSNGNV